MEQLVDDRASKQARIAVSEYLGRIAPVFDVASSLLLVDVVGKSVQRRERRTLLPTDPLRRAGEISDLDTSVLICGAISRPFEQALVSAGIEFFSFLCGDIDDVIAAYVEGRLLEKGFFMPGCCGRRRRCRRRQGGRFGGDSSGPSRRGQS